MTDDHGAEREKAKARTQADKSRLAVQVIWQLCGLLAQHQVPIPAPLKREALTLLSEESDG